jgi:tryptophan synthase alpha subunit
MVSDNLKPFIISNLHQLFIQTYVEVDSSLAKKQYKKIAEGVIVGSAVEEIEELWDLAIESAQEALPSQFVGIIKEIWQEII